MPLQFISAAVLADRIIQSYTLRMLITLSPETVRRLEAMVAHGQFSSPQQAIETALDRLEEDVSFASWEPGQLDAAIQEGIDAADRGETFSGAEVKAHLDRVFGRT